MVEQEALARAIAAGRQELEGIRADAAKRMGPKEAAIFEAQLLMLDDPVLKEGLTEAIQSGKAADEAVREVTARLTATLRNVEDQYLRERAADVEDVARRLLRHLRGMGEERHLRLPEPRIVVTYDLTPSDMAALDPKDVLGVATEVGGPTSHAAILARSLGIPAVMGAEGLLAAVGEGETMVLDGDTGMVLVNVAAEVLRDYDRRARQTRAAREDVPVQPRLRARTTDGRRVKLAANIAGPQEAKAALAVGADGVGLYRTEFLFMQGDQAPSEQVQYEAYRTVLEPMQGRPVIIRTADIGGDKKIPYLPTSVEANPFLGWRGLRVWLDQPDLFKVQLRALWRAGSHGNLLIMFPMVSVREEVRRAKALLDEARLELLAERQTVASAVKVGVMIEVPSAALIAEELAPEVDFFSIGSNDLIQYTLAVDRVNQKVAGLYQPLHPAVLRLIHATVIAAHRHGKWVGICGEMAGSIEYVPILLGLGLDELSMNPGSVPRVKHLIRNVSYSECRAAADEALKAGSAEEVRALAEAVGRKGL